MSKEMKKSLIIAVLIVIGGGLLISSFTFAEGWVIKCIFGFTGFIAQSIGWTSLCFATRKNRSPIFKPCSIVIGLDWKYKNYLKEVKKIKIDENICFFCKEAAGQSSSSPDQPLRCNSCFHVLCDLCMSYGFDGLPKCRVCYSKHELECKSCQSLTKTRDCEVCDF